jgi:GT2 family glycosyltransferase
MGSAVFGEMKQTARKYLSKFRLARQLYVFLKRVEYVLTSKSRAWKYLATLLFIIQKHLLQLTFRHNSRKLNGALEALIDPEFVSKFYGHTAMENAESDPWVSIRSIHQLADPSEFFDCDWYLNSSGPVNSVTPETQELLRHFLRNLAKSGARPSPNLSTNLDSFRRLVSKAALTKLEQKTLEKIFCRGVTELPELVSTHRAPKRESKVAVLVPVFNNWMWTERCLRALTMVKNNAVFDVFVADDCSTDNTAAEIKNRFSGITLISSNQNLGFLQNCNQAFREIASQKTYDFIYLLNNDAEVTAGWLDELLIQMENNPSIALAGSSFLYPDLSIQEAGGIIWQDGSAWNYGRYGSTSKAQYRVAREVDYVSGAGILINLKAFPQGLTFDTRFLPAYYEDTDLAMQSRSNGFSVVVNPHSKVIHHEGKSHGVDLGFGVKAAQEKNQKVFQSKWTNELVSHFRSQSESVDSAAFRLEAAKRPEAIIWIDYQLPNSSRDSGSVRAIALMKLARQSGRYVLFVPQRPHANSQEAKLLESEGIPVFGNLEQAFAFAKSANFRVTTAWVSRIDVFNQYFNDLKKRDSSIKILFDTVDLHALRLDRDSILEGKPSKSLERELDAIENSDVSIVVSKFEQELIASFLPNSNVSVISNIHSPALDSQNERRGMVFVGSFDHHPNQEGIEWFLSNVWPTLPNEVRAEGLKIVGQNPPPKVLSYESDNLHVTGWVPESSEYVRSAKLSIAPLLSGAGVKGKIGEALSLGTPVVTTTIGAEGMNLENKVNALIADTPEHFAGAIVSAMANENLRRTIAENGKKTVIENFSIDIARVELERILNKSVSELK